MESDVNGLARNPQAAAIILAVARQQRKRRTRAYDELSIFSAQDLSQELWASLLTEERRGRLIKAFVCDEAAFRDYMVSLAEVVAKRGIRKAAHGHAIPLSRLTKRDKAKLWHKRGFSLEATFDEIFERQEYWG